MKKLFLMLIWATLCSATFGQDKMTISLEPLSAPQGVDLGSYPQQIFRLLSSEFAESNRFVVMPTDDWNVPQNASVDPYVDVAKQYGVTYLVVGILNGITTATRTTINPNGTIGLGYSARISITLKIINTETGALYNSKTFEIAPFWLKITAEAAVNTAINNLGENIKKWIGEAFPVTIPVLKITSENKKKGAVGILINAGSESGIAEGKGHKKTQFKIVEYKSETINGTSITRTVPVGTAEVASIEGKSLTDCTVTSGGFDVLRKIEEGTKLFAITLN